MHLFALLMHWYHPYTGVDLRYGMEINDFAVTVYHPHTGVDLRAGTPWVSFFRFFVSLLTGVWL